MLLYYLRKDQKPKILLLSALAGALAVLTSAVALVFLLPFALYAIVALWRRLGLGRMLLWVLAALAILAVINGGYLLRNQLEYGQTYQPQALTAQTNEIRNWQVLVSNINRNLALHADLPGLNTESWLRDILTNCMKTWALRSMTRARRWMASSISLKTAPSSRRAAIPYIY